MDPKKTIETYLEALKRGSAGDCENLFTEDGVVISPIYGEKKANEFYRQMFADGSDTKITLLKIFLTEDRNSGACHFVCDWILKDGTCTTLNVVDIFDFSENGKIKKLMIIYDAQKARKAVANLRQT